jgi:hypothetical protein
VPYVGEPIQCSMSIIKLEMLVMDEVQRIGYFFLVKNPV